MKNIPTILAGYLISLSAIPCLAVPNRLVANRHSWTDEAEATPGTFVNFKRYSVSWDLEDGSFTAVHTRESEVAKFYQKDTTYLAIPWQDTEIQWVGVGVPLCLRAWEGKLYLIVFDRESDFSKIRFRYYGQDHKVLAEIAADKFPKTIATQNLWLRRNNGNRNGKPVDEVEAAKKLDPEDIDFQESLTAKIWLQLETGKQYYEMPHRIDSEFLKKFQEKHAVSKLKEIQRAMDPDSAIAAFNEILGDKPQDAAAYCGRGSAYAAKKDWKKALADYDEAIRLNPKDSSAYRSRGIVYAATNDLKRALADCDKAIRLDAKDAEAYRSRGFVHRQIGNIDKSIADFTEALRLRPVFPEAYAGRGLAYGLKADQEKAIADFTEAIRQNPELGALYHYRAHSYESCGERAKAEKDFDKADALGYAPD